jgi:hypothetical protein
LISVVGVHANFSFTIYEVRRSNSEQNLAAYSYRIAS